MVLLQNVQDLAGVDLVGAVVKGQGHHGTGGINGPDIGLLWRGFRLGGILRLLSGVRGIRRGFGLRLRWRLRGGGLSVPGGTRRTALDGQVLRFCGGRGGGAAAADAGEEE